MLAQSGAQALWPPHVRSGACRRTLGRHKVEEVVVHTALESQFRAGCELFGFMYLGCSRGCLGEVYISSRARRRRLAAGWGSARNVCVCVWHCRRARACANVAHLSCKGCRASCTEKSWLPASRTTGGLPFQGSSMAIMDILTACPCRATGADAKSLEQRDQRSRLLGCGGGAEVIAYFALFASCGVLSAPQCAHLAKLAHPESCPRSMHYLVGWVLLGDAVRDNVVTAPLPCAWSRWTQVMWSAASQRVGAAHALEASHAVAAAHGVGAAHIVRAALVAATTHRPTAARAVDATLPVVAVHGVRAADAAEAAHAVPAVHEMSIRCAQPVG